MMSGSVMKSTDPAPTPAGKSGKPGKADEADGTRAAQDQLAQQNLPRFQLVPEPVQAPVQEITAAPVATSAPQATSPLDGAADFLSTQSPSPATVCPAS